MTTGLVWTLSATSGRTHRALAGEAGEDTHGMDGDNETAAGQHNGNSGSYIGMTAQKVKRIYTCMVTDC